MSVPYPIPVTATQVGTYFVGQYYKVMEQQPEYAHQFYNDASTMLRVHGTATESASTLFQIHALIMSLKYTGFEIRTAHALESWRGGVLVMVSGFVQVKDFTGRKKFVETFFLAPQDKGYFVLSDVFHFIDEEPASHLPVVLLAQNNMDSKLNAPTAISEPVPSYLLGGEIQATPTELAADADTRGNGPVDNYIFTNQQFQKASESENVWEQNFVEETNGSLQNARNAAQDRLPVPVEEPTAEPVKQTYASILQVARGQPASTASRPSDKKGATGLELNHSPQTTALQESMSFKSFETSVSDTVDEVSTAEDEDEIRSVYVRNLTPDTSEADIEEEFRNFGKIARDGVVIRSRKDVGVCYAFVEFEDMTGVYNAVKAGSASVAGRQVYIEERRPNSKIPSRLGRGRGRSSRGSYQIDASRGHFGARNFGRAGGYDGGYWDYNRSRGNGYNRLSSQQDRGFSGHQSARSGQDEMEETF